MENLSEQFEQETGHRPCRTEPVPDPMSGNEGVKVCCLSCGVVVEKAFSSICIGADGSFSPELFPKYVSGSVRDAIIRMKEIPCTGSKASDGSPFDWSKIWF